MDKLLAALRKDDIAFMELMGVALALSCGFWMSMPWDTFKVSSSWDIAADIAPEPVWGAWLIAVGLVKVWSIRTQVFSWRRRTTVALFLTFLSFSLMFFVSEPRAILSVTWLNIAGAFGYGYLRMGAQ